MSTYNGWTIVAMPSSPAPKTVEFSTNSIVALSTSPFTAQQQIQDWQASWMEATVTLPPMTQSDAAAWTAFFLACNGPACVFQLSNSTFAGLVPSGAVPGAYWRMKGNTVKWSITEGVLYNLQFEIREAI